MRSAPVLLIFLACGGSEDDSDDSEETTTAAPSTTTTPSSTTTGPSGPDCADPGGAVSAELITLTTRDDIRLEADLYAGVAGCPGVVLIHMIPPSNNRDGWPSEFIDRLTAHGWSVVAYDRRGTRNSEGIPVDSFEGEAGRWDVEAAVAALTDAGAEGLALIGASNGTASVIDYAAWASAEGLPEVLAMGFMSGGGYTEAQTSMADVPSVPAVFTYDPSEAAWPEGQMQYDPGNWVFHEYDGGGHGTQTFGLKPKVKGDLEDFLVESL